MPAATARLTPGPLVHVLLRRAVDQTRYENATVRAIQARVRTFVGQALAAVRAVGLYDPRPGPGGLARGRLDDPQRVQTLLITLAGAWRVVMQDAAALLGRDLQAFTELELLEVPPAIQALLDRPPTLQEAEGDLPPMFQQVPVAQLAQLITSPLGGATYAQAFADLAVSVLTRLRSALQIGLQRGESVAQVARRVRLVLQSPLWQAERIVRTEYVRAAAQADRALYDQNRELLRGVQWVATLDRRTCVQCGALDGRTWSPPSRAPLPTVHTHPNCRCVLVPIIKALPGLTLPTGTRASMAGQVPATQTYGAWFGQQGTAFQRDVLGPTRYRLFQQGTLQLKDFSTAAGVRSVADALALARRRQ